MTTFIYFTNYNSKFTNKGPSNLESHNNKENERWAISPKQSVAKIWEIKIKRWFWIPAEGKDKNWTHLSYRKQDNGDFETLVRNS